MKNLLRVDYQNILSLAVFEFKKRSLDTYFGWLWSIVSPLSQMFILLFILKYVFKSQQEHLVLWLISGITVWTFIQTSLLKTCSTLTSKKMLIQNQNIKQWQFILADLLSEFITFSPFVLVAIVMSLVENTMSIKLFMVIYLLITLVSFLYGLALIFSIFTVFVRDLPHLLTLVLQISFWLTPIAYSKHMLDGNIALFISINPFSYYVELSQVIFLNSNMTITLIIMPLVISIVSLIVGSLVYKKYKNKVAIYL